MGKEHLVDGAWLMCTSGSAPARFKLTEGHGYTSGGRSIANCKDCKAGEHIPCFGNCKNNTKTKTCEGFINLSDEWVSTTFSDKTPEQVSGEDVITMDSVLLCNKGGIIIPLTSGQGYDNGINWNAYSKRYQKAALWMLGKNLMCQIFGNDPINLNTGNYIYEKEDLVIPGITKLSFRLFYNSMGKGREGCVGEGWRHNGEISVRQEQNGNWLFLCLDDGRELPYRRTIGDIYAPLFKGEGLLKKEKEGFRYCAGGMKEYLFDGNGKILSKQDRNGNKDFFSYDGAGRLIKINGANGGKLTYVYNREGNLIRVSDHAGREIRLWYRYRRLWKFINTSGYAYIYHYNEDGKLESVTTPRGITGIYNEYDGVGRVTKQVLSDGGTAELRYDDVNMCTYFREPEGSISIHKSDEKFRNIANVYGEKEESCGYNDNNQKTFYVDRNGNTTRYHYDENGRLTGVTDALGQQTKYSYDKDGRLLAVSRGKKELGRNTYDGKGRLVKVTDALGRCRETFYNQRGLPEKILQPDGSCILFAYDTRGNMECITDPYGGTLHYSYDSLNRLESYSDSEGNSVHYQYDEGNRITVVTNQEGNRRTYDYNENGKPSVIRDFDGKEICIGYGATNIPEEMTDKEGRSIRRKYDKRGNLSEETLPSGAVISYYYDVRNCLEKVEVRKTAEEDAVTVITYGHDPAGNLISVKVGNGKEVLSESSHGYDALNRLVYTVDPSGGKTVYTYDENGNVNSITDPAGNIRTFVYNNAGELLEETDARGNVTRYSYNALGKKESVTDSKGRVTQYFYLPGGRLEKVLYAGGREEKYTYDLLGRVKTKTDGDGNCFSHFYDCMGRVSEVNRNGKPWVKYAYDALSRVTSVTDAAGHTTYYEYTPNGKLRGVTDALGNRTEYGYDGTGKMAHVRQHGKEGEADRESFYEWNPLGQLECIRDASGREERFSYDALGRTVLRVDSEGYCTEYSYTPDGKVKDVLYGDGSRVEMEYGALRKLEAVRDWLGETIIERNPYGDPIRITDHKGQTVEYEWGTMGERTGIRYPGGKTVNYEFDGLCRLKEMVRRERGKDDLRILYRYDGDGRLSEKQMPGNLHTFYKYNREGLLEDLFHEDGQGVLEHIHYGYDAGGNKVLVEKERAGMPKENGRYVYRYDALNRLTGTEKDGKPLRNYRYDTFGNRTEMEDFEKGKKSLYFYNSLNQILSEEIWDWEGLQPDGNTGSVLSATVEYEHDFRGNLTAEYQNGKLVHGYAYNAMNRLARVWDGEGREAEYRYNGLGQRAERIGKEEGEEYLLDLSRPFHNLLELRKGKHRQSFYWDVGVAAMEQEGDPPKYFLDDELGSPLRVLYGTGKGNIYAYDEFGNDLYGERAGATGRCSKAGEGQPFGYTGYRYDDIGGTYFAQAREYMAAKGRFSAVDVMRGNGAVPNTLNRYGYCWGNPLSLVDWDGLMPEWLEGIYAHLQFQAEFLTLYGYIEDLYVGSNVLTDGQGNVVCYGAVNVKIPGGGKKGGDGFADAVVFDNNVAYIYELKPQRYHENISYSTERKEGIKQLERYVDTYNANGGKARKGDEMTINLILDIEQPFLFDSDKTIIYRMYEDDPGMVYYEINGNGGDGTKRVELLTSEELDSYEMPLTIAMVTMYAAVVGLGNAALAGTVSAAFNSIFPLIIIDRDIWDNIINWDPQRNCNQIA
mgnify:CR=1 FL=1